MAAAPSPFWPRFGEGVRREGQAEWIYAMFHASRLLAVGGAMILLGTMGMQYGTAPLGISLGLLGLVIFTGLSVIFFLLGWVALHDASTRWTSTLVVFAISVAGFAGGIAVTIATIYPLGEFPRHLVWALLGGYLVLPYQPGVFVPVVVAQSVLFLLTAPGAPPGRARAAILLGSFALLAAVVAAIVAHALAGFAVIPPAESFAGATVVGYALVAWGWWRAYEASGIVLSRFWLGPRPLSGLRAGSEGIRRTPNDDSALPKP